VIRHSPSQEINTRVEALGETRLPQLQHPGVVIQPANLRLHHVEQLGDELVAKHVHLLGDH
jgi:hypothetical protein